MIDPHVHLRDWSQSAKETMAHGFSVAWQAGITGVFEMPNTDPPLTSKSAAIRRIAEADEALARLGIPLFHGMYLGLTEEENQIDEVVRAHRELFPRVVGFKLYASHSTGGMGVTSIPGQLRVWRALSARSYRGVVAVHAEREDLLRPEAWDPGRPETHALTRPPLAEVASVQTQLALAEAAGFRGHLHICHVSVADTVTLLRAEAPALPFSVSLGVTPHHLLLNEEVASQSAVPEWNVNPPLRSEANRRALWEALATGEIDWIESDHAPHTLSDKEAGASGLPGLPAYRLLVDRLAGDTATAVRAPQTGLSEWTGGAVCRVFGIGAHHFPDNPNSPFAPQGAVPFSYSRLAREYPWDPYRFLVRNT